MPCRLMVDPILLCAPGFIEQGHVVLQIVDGSCSLVGLGLGQFPLLLQDQQTRLIGGHQSAFFCG